MEIIPKKIRWTLLSPLFIFSVLLMLVNDHVLKGSWPFPSMVTGKLSDFAFLFFLPVVMAFIFQVKTKFGLSLSYVVVGILFSAINISPGFSRFVETLFGSLFIPLVLWPDVTDLVALTMLPCSALFLWRKAPTRYVPYVKNLRYSLVLLSLVTCVATSPYHGNYWRATHEPVYMPWEEFRESVRVLPPQDIKKRGKIYVKDNYLYVNEPYKGIHVFDNTNPKKPVAKCFLHIIGNVDLSIKGSFLYADSYVDLLVFALTIYPEDITLVNRIEDVFSYDAYQNLPFDEQSDPNNRAFFSPGYADPKKGVVIGWRKIQER
jgi:hypothetical protein